MKKLLRIALVALTLSTGLEAIISKRGSQSSEFKKLHRSTKHSNTKHGDKKVHADKVNIVSYIEPILEGNTYVIACSKALGIKKRAKDTKFHVGIYEMRKKGDQKVKGTIIHQGYASKSGLFRFRALGKGLYVAQVSLVSPIKDKVIARTLSKKHNKNITHEALIQKSFGMKVVRLHNKTLIRHRDMRDRDMRDRDMRDRDMRDRDMRDRDMRSNKKNRERKLRTTKKDKSPEVLRG